MREEGAAGSREGSVWVVRNTKRWRLLCSIAVCISRPFLVQETPLILSNLMNCFCWVTVLLAKELFLVLDPFPARWAAYAVWSQPRPVSCSRCLIPRCPALLLSDPVVFIISCFLLRSVYYTLFCICIAWSWGSHIISCCLILMLPNTAPAP